MHSITPTTQSTMQSTTPTTPTTQSITPTTKIHSSTIGTLFEDQRPYIFMPQTVKSGEKIIVNVFFYSPQLYLYQCVIFIFFDQNKLFFKKEISNDNYSVSNIYNDPNYYRFTINHKNGLNTNNLPLRYKNTNFFHVISLEFTCLLGVIETVTTPITSMINYIVTYDTITKNWLNNNENPKHVYFLNKDALTATTYSLPPQNISITTAYEKLRCYIVAKESDTDNSVIDVSLYIFFLFEYPYNKLFTRFFCFIKYDTNNLINTSQTTLESPLYDSKWISELNTELNEKIIVINLGRELNEINEQLTTATKPEPLTKICNFKMQKKNSNYQINNKTISGTLNSLSFGSTLICADDLNTNISDQSCSKNNTIYGKYFDVSDSSLQLIKDIKNPADRYPA